MRAPLVLALLAGGVAPGLAQLPPQPPLPPPPEVDCIPAGILSIVGIERQLTGPQDGGRLSIHVTLQNRSPRPAAFIMSFTAPNVQMPAVKQWRSLEAQERATYLVGTLPRGTLVTDEELRGHLQLRCVR